MRRKPTASIRIFPAVALLAILCVGIVMESHGAKLDLVAAASKAAKKKLSAADTVLPSPIADDSPIDPTGKARKTDSTKKKKGKAAKSAKSNTKTSSDSGMTVKDK
jgi:hypothetical protein